MLYDTLQAEFCPPLDTSLLAALIADLGDEPPSSDQLDTLRTTLKELANQATAQHDYELDSAHFSPLCVATDESSCPDFCADMTEWSTASDSSAMSRQSFSSPFGFLQAALPHIPQSQLRRVLNEAGVDEGDVDMESVVEALLTNEFIRDLEERGLGALEDDDRSPYSLDGGLWKRVESKKKLTSPRAAKKKIRGTTIPLVDIRQKHHLPSPASPAPSAPDPWTQLCSISDHLATLLPSHAASFFLSHFHSPSYASPAKALRAALTSVASSAPFDTNTASLFTMLDILCDSPVYASLDPEQRFGLYEDAQLALHATRGRGDDAIDVVWLLLDLDLDLASGTLTMGVYHAPQSPLSPSPSSAWVAPSIPPLPRPAGRDRSASASGATRQLPSGPPPVQPPPTSKRKSVPASPGTSLETPDPFQWQTVPQKPPKGPHPLALHIPAYDSVNQSRRSGGVGKGGRGDAEIRPNRRQRLAANLMKRDEMLREASKAWNRGSTKNRGGEVALYFAERARGYAELARREALDEARIMVESKRVAAVDRTVDLHGTSISEAIVIVREILEREACSPANPLKIITGRGTHSANGVGVLKPAVRNALVRDGWNVGVWDGGLVVRGRT